MRIAQRSPYWYAPQGEKGRKAWCIACGERLTGRLHGSTPTGQAAAANGSAVPVAQPAAQPTAQPVDDSDPWDGAPAQHAPAQAPSAAPITAPASPADPLAQAIARAVAPLIESATRGSLDTDAARALVRDELAHLARRLKRRGLGETAPETVDYVPQADADYDPDTDAGRALRACISTASHAWVSGPSGSGKTFPALQECAALGRPVVYLSCSEGMDRSSLLGTWILRREGKNPQPVMHWQHGPLPRAMASGAVLVLDEADKLSPALSALLFGVCEPGKPRALVVPECGQEIAPAPGWTMIATGNTLRDESGLYSGQRPDAALVSRLLHVAADYLPQATEARILARHAPGGVPTGQRIAVALKALRDLHGRGKSDTPPSLRVGICVARLLAGTMPSGAPNPGGRLQWADAWGLAYLGSLAPSQAAAAAQAIGKGA